MPNTAFSIFKFEFKTPLHIATVRADYASTQSRLHSDSLYSAIIHTWRILGIEHPIFENPSADLGFTLSSLFPYTIDANKVPVYFFPKPYGFLNDRHLDLKQKPEAKKLKKIQYFDTDFFNKFLNQTPLTPDDYQDSLYGQFLTKLSIDKDFMKSDVLPRVYVPRYGELEKVVKDGKTEWQSPDTEIYYLERIFFRPGSGFFCLAQFDNDQIRKDVKAALHYLQDEGLGTDRHVGNGLFILDDKQTLALTLPESTDYYLNLSLYCPPDLDTLRQILTEDSSFDTLRRGGWITSAPYISLRKRAVNMFKEGSIFQILADTPHFKTLAGAKIGGQTLDLKPDTTILPDISKEIHSIYRVGKSFFLPLKLTV